MTLQSVFSLLILPMLWVFVTMSTDDVRVNSSSTVVLHVTNWTNNSHPNNSHPNNNHPNNSHPNNSRPNNSHDALSNVDSSMIQRALYVLVGITMLGVLYFLVRAVRLRKPTQRKKYGLLANYDDSVEMDAMESDEDETLYEARSLRR
ncbi:protein FAM174C isoform 1-T1 [Polymixia lowei]